MRLFLAFLVIVIILPQTEFDNLLLRRFNETGLFSNYAEAKSFLKWLTWIVIFLFLVLNLIISIK